MAPVTSSSHPDDDDGRPPQINITVETLETVYFHSQWRYSKSYLPLTKDEKADYYKAYDPMMGVKIAGTLSVLFILAVLYVLYKVRLLLFFPLLIQRNLFRTVFVSFVVGIY